MAQHSETVSFGRCSPQAILRRVAYCALQLVVLLLTISVFSASVFAAVRFYTDRSQFEKAVGQESLFYINASNVALAEEVDQIPGRNRIVGAIKYPGEGSTLTFPKRSTGLPFSFELTAMEPGARWTFDDDEDPSQNLPTFDNALSVGDIDNHQNDDWRLKAFNDEAPRGFGFVLRDNHGASGEFIQLLDRQGNQVAVVQIGNQTLEVFLGVVSDIEFSEIRFDEDSGGDDIAIADFHFALASDVENVDLGDAIDALAAVNRREQWFTVYDEIPPALTLEQPDPQLEATDIGGVALARVRDELLAGVLAVDACDRPAGLSHDMPALLPISTTEVTWRASDQGPKDASGEPNVVERVQQITVVDTQAPIMVPPPGKVVEIPIGETGINAAEVDLGVPQVVDLADPTPDVSNDAPAVFPVSIRTSVLWEAADHAEPQPNVATAEQLITVKPEGTNTAPQVGNSTASTLTSQPGGPYPEAFNGEQPPGQWIYQNICVAIPDNPRRDWVYQPKFLSVGDDGITMIIDEAWRCEDGSSIAKPDSRISKWDGDGNFIGEIQYPSSNDTFVMDPDGYLYTVELKYSDNGLRVVQHRTDWTGNMIGSSVWVDTWKFDYSNKASGIPRLDENRLSYARADTRNRVIYVHDAEEIWVYDIRPEIADPAPNSVGMQPERILGVLNGGLPTLNKDCRSSGGYAMELDSQGALYVIDSCNHQVHKFTASYFQPDGQFVLGDYVGWMGRCETSTNKACDETTKTTKGYSCTNETCTSLERNNRGDMTGQFSGPRFLAMGPNDVLYVADSGNFRIQRFAPDGTFAGEAVSTGSGVNQGKHPDFALSNMGRPKAVSVNSKKFFVVDQVESFVHTFETSPCPIASAAVFPR
ncbi:MAG: hypothetical protein GY703_21925 [Gammaproteobacteria bacterium]|nr:hypothetical protein [Gammaproteobacteria bacterium]